MAIAIESLRVLIIADSESAVGALRAWIREIAWLAAAHVTVDQWTVDRTAELRPDEDRHDVILLELSRQHAANLELVRAVRRLVPATPVVAMTESGDDAFEAEVLLEGASDCLALSGVEKSALSRALARALAARTISRDGLGTGLGFDVIVEDVTERRQLEQQLRHAQKMEAVGRLAGGIAHDFNNVLTAMLGHLEMLGDQFAQNDPRHAELNEIRRVAERASALTRQLLSFSRRTAAQPEAIDVDAVIARVQRMLSRLIGEDIELAVRLGAEAGRALTDAGQLEQVVMNLAVNGRDAMPGGGRLTIETASLELEEEAAAQHGVAAGPIVRVSVSDNGSGIPPDVMPRLFEPFFTTKDPGKGTGLGLAIVHGIVRQCGGFVTVESEVGRGTVFHVHLPRLAAAPLADAGGSATSAGSA
jgi:signal transduction histidine kinase